MAARDRLPYRPAMAAVVAIGEMDVLLGHLDYRERVEELLAAPSAVRIHLVAETVHPRDPNPLMPLRAQFRGVSFCETSLALVRFADGGHCDDRAGGRARGR